MISPDCMENSPVGLSFQERDQALDHLLAAIDEHRWPSFHPAEHGMIAWQHGYCVDEKLFCDDLFI